MDIKFLKYNSLEELNSEVKVPEGQPDMLAKSAPKVLSKARKLSQSDLEMVTKIQTSTELHFLS